MNKLTDYIISLTHLYGLVHRDKVVEIYNMQNEDQIEDIDTVRLRAGNIEINFSELDKNFVEVFNDYFVAESILEFDNFDEQLSQRKGKPFYIPEQEELLKYKVETYFEVIKEYEQLVNYLTKNLLDGDEFKAEMACEDIQGICQFGFSMQNIFDVFNNRNINFESEGQVSEVMQLIMDFANNTRLWENNGHTPNEIFEKHEKPNLRPLPKGVFPEFMDQAKSNKTVGRNDPCPCGSGKKYKKCCSH